MAARRPAPLGSDWLLPAIFAQHRTSVQITHKGSSEIVLFIEAEHRYYFKKSKLKKEKTLKEQVIYSFYVTLDT